MPFYTHIVRCSDASYYVGHTDDLEKRRPSGRSSTGSPGRPRLFLEEAGSESCVVAYIRSKLWTYVLLAHADFR
jgi:hypothetical protein